MIRKVLSVVAVVLTSFTVSNSQSPKIEVPKLPTELDKFGGRPGSFRFTTNERTMANAAAMQQAYEALDMIDAKLAKIDPKIRAQLAPEIERLRKFTDGVHEQTLQSAGETAMQVEERLNASKGKFMCGACHGHGMGMMMMQHGGAGTARNE